MGRRLKMTKRVKETILRSVEAGNTIGFTLESMSIGRSTEWEARKADPAYAAALEGVLELRTEIVEDALYQKAVGGDVQAQKFFLVNRGYPRWKNNYWPTKDDGSDAELGGMLMLPIREVVIERPMPREIPMGEAGSDDKA